MGGGGGGGTFLTSVTFVAKVRNAPLYRAEITDYQQVIQKEK
jgi:hypothetical protein